MAGHCRGKSNRAILACRREASARGAARLRVCRRWGASWPAEGKGMMEVDGACEGPAEERRRGGGGAATGELGRDVGSGA